MRAREAIRVEAFGTPEEVAEAVVVPASEESSDVTGVERGLVRIASAVDLGGFDMIKHAGAPV